MLYRCDRHPDLRADYLPGTAGVVASRRSPASTSAMPIRRRSRTRLRGWLLGWGVGRGGDVWRRGAWFWISRMGWSARAAIRYGFMSLLRLFGCRFLGAGGGPGRR